MKKSATLIVLLLFTLGSAFAQTQRVTGTVTAQDNNQGLPGVSVLVKGTSNGTATDGEGNYSLSVPPNATLVFSFIGYTSQEIVVGERSVVNVLLVPDQQALSEVVVVGYGTQKKSDVTGAISSVKEQEIAFRPVASAEQALQGKAAGVLITSNNGTPGEPPTIRIRGVSTVGNSNPLFVVDGMFVDNINYLNPADIASIEVLKDASSLAIYGVRGANGVILVTTKGGQAGQTSVTYDGYAGFSQVQNLIPMANSADYVTLNNEARRNSDPNNPNVPLIPASAAATNTNWYNEIFRTGYIQNHQLNVAGGSERLTYNVSANYFSQQGNVRTSDFERITLRFNNSYQATKFLKLGSNLAFTRFRSDNVPASVVQSAYLAPPTIPVRLPNGDFGFPTSENSGTTVANPVAQLAFNDNFTRGARLVGSVFADVNFLKYFTFRSNFGLDANLDRTFDFVPQYRVSAFQFSERSRLTKGYSVGSSLLWENTLNFTRTFNDAHNVTVLAGITSQRIQGETFGGTRNDVPGYSRSVQYLNLGNEVGQTNSDGGFVFTYLSYLLRVNYSFLDRYLLTASFRRDGSSRFPASNRYGNFPAIGVGWRISEEAFMKNQTVVSNLKLRASYGLLGNTNIQDYLFIPKIAPNLNPIFGQGQTPQPGATELNPVTSNLLWESVRQLDIGMEVGLLANKLSLEVDYYDRTTSDMILNVRRPGGIQIDENAARARNRGVELSARWNDKTDFGLTYSIAANLTTVNNRVLDLGNGGVAIIGGSLGNGRNATFTDVGNPIGAFWGYQVAGVFQTADQVRGGAQPNAQPGDLIFRDQNNDNRIDGDDRVYLGSPLPSVFWGFNSNLAYGAFDLAFDLQGTHGNKIYNGRRALRFGNENYEQSVMNRWTGPNSTNADPRVTNGGDNYEVSDYFIQNGGFVRIRNVQLGYRFPKTLLDRVRLKALRVYVNALNPVTITQYKGFSPEVGSQA
nr:TonB-dependent receptor [Cytophagales bacterium]